MLRHRGSTVFGRVNPYVPAAVILGGAVLFALGYRWVGLGVGVGACLAFINGLVLSRRVEFAADIGDMGRALMVMQLGLLISFGVIAVVTVVLVHFSIPMAVASAAGFAVTQLGILAAFYWTRGRQDVVVEREVP